jgi:hypothetical protein
MNPNTIKLEPAVLLMGQSGTGKTFSLSTLIESGLEVFLITTEPNGLESLLDAMATKGLDIHKLHYHVISPARPDFTSLAKMATLVSLSDQAALSAIKPGSERSNAQWIELLKTLNNFTCDRTGEIFGPVDKLGPNRAVVIDSLSGLNLMAMDITVGDKVTASPGEWGIAMKLLDKLLITLTSNLTSTFILTAHTEREVDEISGASQIMVSSLGRKLAPQIPKFFSEIVLTHVQTDGDRRTYYWSTNTQNYTLKNRSLPVGSRLEPSFKPIIAAFHRRQEQLKPKPVTTTA